MCVIHIVYMQYTMNSVHVYALEKNIFFRKNKRKNLNRPFVTHGHFDYS